MELMMKEDQVVLALSGKSDQNADLHMFPAEVS